MKNESINQLPLFDVAVVGGGLAGLTAALYAAREGRSVIVFERAPQLGGRASTQNKEGFSFNQGPHALYCGGEGVQILRELGISYSGAKATPEGSWVLRNGEKHRTPRDAVSLGLTSLLTVKSKLEAAKLFSGLDRIPTEEWNHRTLREWLDTQIQHEDVRALFEGLFRLSTYCNDPEVQSAGAALAQMIMGQAGVDYLDGGWQTLVEKLRNEAEFVGAQLVQRGAVETIQCNGGTNTISLANGDNYSARTVIATISPSMLKNLVNSGNVASLQEWSNQAIPIYASCLDIALKRLPHTENQFAIGLDDPLYYSVHTRSARLAPEGGAVIQLAKYLRFDVKSDGSELEQELEALMDFMQPGWREELVAKRFLPRMLVSNAVVTAAQGGYSGRPGPSVPEIPNLFVAGDWVGAHGMLADTSLASAKEAAKLALQWLSADSAAIGERKLAAV